MQPLVLFGPLDAVDPFIQYIVLVLVLANLGTRMIAHNRHTSQAEDGADAITRHLGHEATNVLLVIASFYMMLVEYHGGFVMAMLVVGMVVTDFFEFEARKVEARAETSLDLPKGAITASLFVVSYALFQAFWFLVEGYWKAIVS